MNLSSTMRYCREAPMNARMRNGWHRLPSGYDVEIRHGVPVRISNNGRSGAISDEGLCAETVALADLPVTIGEWTAGEGPGELEAPLFVDGGAFSEVLARLARAAAALFVDRYHKPVDAGDTDWDRLEYLKDFGAALGHCRLQAADVDQDACFDGYVEILHRETRRLARTANPPPVDPE
jgi:hypothetical protein